MHTIVPAVHRKRTWLAGWLKPNKKLRHAEICMYMELNNRLHKSFPSALAMTSRGGLPNACHGDPACWRPMAVGYTKGVRADQRRSPATVIYGSIVPYEHTVTKQAPLTLSRLRASRV